MGHSLVFMPECHSTNNEASQLIETSSNVPEGTLVITNDQTSGRGQRGSSWLSETGKNLTFSLVLKPIFLTARDQFYLNKTISLGLWDYLSRALTAGIKIKWPNDILVSNKKICGILIENHIQGQHIQHSIVGIGLNVNQSNFSLPTATSMKLQGDAEFLLEDVLTELLGCLETRYLQLRSGKFDGLSNDYADTMYWIGEMHLFKKKEDIFEGVITGIDLFGRLKVNVDGTTEYFEVKEVQFLK